MSGALLDITVDPTQERKQAQEEVNKELLSGPSPSRGLPTAPVTIVEFGDFECSFCKTFHEWTRVLADANFRLVFKHLPLHGHPWARDAAAFAVCAEEQSSDAFWHLHDFFYANQATLNTENLEDRVMQFVAELPDGSRIDGSRLLMCSHSHGADRKIARDADLASRFRIVGTPTLFLNGVRMDTLRSVDDLRSLIERASTENPSGGTK